jgi:hypothetical protein
MNVNSGMPTPSLITPLNDLQVDALLQKVDMNHSFLQMATGDQELISLMKETI